MSGIDAEPTEIEIAEAIQAFDLAVWFGGPTVLTIRRMAFQLDRLREELRVMTTAADAEDARRYRTLRRAARNGALEFIAAVSQLDHCLTDDLVDSSVDEAEKLWPGCFVTRVDEEMMRETSE